MQENTSSANKNELDALPDAFSFDADTEERVQQKWQQVRSYGFTAGGLNFIAPLNVYCELLTDCRIEPVPNAPKHFLGLTNVRGNLIPIYQLEPLLEVKPLSRKYAFVIGKLDHAGAIIIDGKPKPFDFRDFESNTQPNNIPTFLQSCIRDYYSLEDQAWQLIDHAVLFNQLANTL